MRSEPDSGVKAFCSEAEPATRCNWGLLTAEMRKHERQWAFRRSAMRNAVFPQRYVIAEVLRAAATLARAHHGKTPHRLITRVPSLLMQGIQVVCRVAGACTGLYFLHFQCPASGRDDLSSRAHPRLERPTAHSPARRLKTPDASTSVPPPTLQHTRSVVIHGVFICATMQISSAPQYCGVISYVTVSTLGAAGLHVTAHGLRRVLILHSA
jgi:hypothetical protein